MFYMITTEILARSFLSSITGENHKFIIYALRQRARADNLTICSHRKQIEVNFSCVCPVNDNEFRQHCQSSLQVDNSFDNVMT